MNLRSSFNRAFTLIELLVVITIIAVLAGLLLPVTSKVMENARKASGKSTESQIVNAVNQYFAEYGSYPVPVTTGGAAATSDYTYDDGTKGKHNGVLFNVLRGINDSSDSTTGTLNARRVSYFEMKNVKNVTTPKDGFILTGTPRSGNGTTLAVGDLVDPWGNLYFIRLDADYTNAVGNPYAATTDNAADATDAKNLRTGVIAYSYGLDGKIGNAGNTGSTPWTPAPGDDVVSWQ